MAATVHGESAQGRHARRRGCHYIGVHLSAKVYRGRPVCIGGYFRLENSTFKCSKIISRRLKCSFLTIKCTQLCTNWCRITFRVRRSRDEMYIGHGRLCVCVFVPRRIPTLLQETGCNFGKVGVPSSCALLGGFAGICAVPKQHSTLIQQIRQRQ